MVCVMKINNNLSLVYDIAGLKAFSAPISQEVFEANFKLISATKSALFSGDWRQAVQVGQVIATLTLLDEGKKLAEKNEQKGNFGATALLHEIKRLTTLLVPSDKGWDYETVDSCIKSGKIEEEDWKEAESDLLFFTCVYALSRKSEKKNAVEALCLIQRFIPNYSTLEEYTNSLPISTMKEISKRKAVSSVPV